MTLRYVQALMKIFDLQHALEKMEGAGANFYSIMGLKPSATLAQIRKAYREKSLEWQYVSFAHTAPTRTRAYPMRTSGLSSSA